jgi:hypothetical protein
MSRQSDVWLAKLRDQAREPGVLLVIVRRPIGGSIAIFPDEILSKSDDELRAFLHARLAER